VGERHEPQPKSGVCTCIGRLTRGNQFCRAGSAGTKLGLGRCVRLCAHACTSPVSGVPFSPRVEAPTRFPMSAERRQTATHATLTACEVLSSLCLAGANCVRPKWGSGHGSVEMACCVGAHRCAIGHMRGWYVVLVRVRCARPSGGEIWIFISPFLTFPHTQPLSQACHMCLQ